MNSNTKGGTDCRANAISFFFFLFSDEVATNDKCSAGPRMPWYMDIVKDGINSPLRVTKRKEGGQGR